MDGSEGLKVQLSFITKFNSACPFIVNVTCNHTTNFLSPVGTTNPRRMMVCKKDTKLTNIPVFPHKPANGEKDTTLSLAGEISGRGNGAPTPSLGSGFGPNELQLNTDDLPVLQPASGKRLY